MIEAWYAALTQRIADARKVLGRPLNLTEKILYAHLHNASPLQGTILPPDRRLESYALAGIAKFSPTEGGSSKEATIKIAYMIRELG